MQESYTPKLGCVYCGTSKADVEYFQEQHPEVKEPVCCESCWTEIGENAEILPSYLAGYFKPVARGGSNV